MQYLKDAAGIDYLPPSNEPATHGTRIEIPNGYGQHVPGTMLSGHAIPDSAS